MAGRPVAPSLCLPAQDLGEFRARGPQVGRVLAGRRGAGDEFVEARQVREHLVAAGQLLVAVETADPDVQKSRAILVRGAEGGFELHAIVARHGFLFGEVVYPNPHLPGGRPKLPAWSKSHLLARPGLKSRKFGPEGTSPWKPRRDGRR